MEIKGFTTINHAVRVKLGLTLQEYVILDFLYRWQAKCADVPKKDDWYSALGIDNNKDSVIVLISHLARRGFLDLNHKITPLFSSEFVSSVGLGDDNKTANKSKNSRSKSVSVKKQFIPPTLVEVQQFFKENDYQIEFAKKAFDYYVDGNWTDKSGTPVVNWKQKIRANWFKEEYKILSLQKNHISNSSIGENLIEMGKKYKK